MHLFSIPHGRHRSQRAHINHYCFPNGLKSQILRLFDYLSRKHLVISVTSPVLDQVLLPLALFNQLVFNKSHCGLLFNGRYGIIIVVSPSFIIVADSVFDDGSVYCFIFATHHIQFSKPALFCDPITFL